MSHPEQVDFCNRVRILHPHFFNNVTALEVGSASINGDNNHLFHKSRLLRIDIWPGENVDQVIGCKDHLAKPQYENHYDVIISTEMLEHDRTWNTDLQLMYWALKPGGLLLLTAGGDGRPEHGTKGHSSGCSPATNDYYQNISNEMIGSVLRPDMFKEYFLKQCPLNCDMQFYGVKK